FPLWEAGQVAAVHAVGLPTPTHSHAAALDAAERAGGTGGWLGRALGTAGPTATLHLGGALAPVVLGGVRPPFALTDLAGTAGVSPVAAVGPAAWQAALRGLGPGTAPLVTGLATGDLLAKARDAAVPPPTGYPPTRLGTALHEVV